MELLRRFALGDPRPSKDNERVDVLYLTAIREDELAKHDQNC